MYKTVNIQIRPTGLVPSRDVETNRKVSTQFRVSTIFLLRSFSFHRSSSHQAVCITIVGESLLAQKSINLAELAVHEDAMQRVLLNLFGLICCISLCKTSVLEPFAVPISSHELYNLNQLENQLSNGKPIWNVKCHVS